MQQMKIKAQMLSHPGDPRGSTLACALLPGQPLPFSADMAMLAKGMIQTKRDHQQLSSAL